jgi:hypothetical protein
MPSFGQGEWGAYLASKEAGDVVGSEKSSLALRIFSRCGRFASSREWVDDLGFFRNRCYSLQKAIGPE